MKFFNKPQGIFIAIIVIVLSTFIASLTIYYLNGVKVKNIFSRWEYGMLWRVLFDSSVRGDIRLSAIKSLGIGLLASMTVPALILVKLNSDDKQSLYGDAKFANDADIRKSRSVTWGDASKGGVIIGRYKGKLIRYTQPDFISMGAGTRAGKGAGIVIPNLLDFWMSMLILDPKQECYNITSLYRQKVLGHKVYLFDPFSKKTHGFNALFYIDLNEPSGMTDLLGLAETIYQTGGLEGAEKHFNSEAQKIYCAYAQLLWFLINYMPDDLKTYEVKNCFSIGTVLELYNQLPAETIVNNRDDYLELCDNAHIRFMVIDACNKIKAFSELGDDPKASVSGTFTGKLNLFTLPLFREATDRNDFDLRNMRKEKMTVYLGIMATEVDIANNLLNLFFNFAIKVNMRENPDFVPEIKYDVLNLLDEFPAIGSMPYIKKASGFIAGYRLKLLTIYQNLSQLNEIYGIEGAKSLMANHPCKIIYAVNEKEDADKFSAQLGYQTLKATSKSKNNASKGGSSRGESESDSSRALVLPQELGTLNFDEQFILLKGENPIKCNKAFYFNDHYFMDKLVSISPKLEAEVKRLNKGVATGKAGLKYPPKEIMLSFGELEAVNF